MTKLLFPVLTAALLTGQAIAAQSKAGSIQGVWRIVEATITGPQARTISFRERPNLTIITAKHYSRVEVQADGPRATLADPATATADELRAAWGPFFGEAGTYEIDGNVITMHPIAAKDPAAMKPDAFSTWSYKLEGDTLWVTAQKNQGGPIAHPVTVKAIRVE